MSECKHTTDEGEEIVFPEGMPRCTTHHHACDCREYLHKQRIAGLEQEVARLREAVEKIKTEEAWYGVLSRAWVVYVLEAALNEEGG